MLSLRGSGSRWVLVNIISIPLINNLAVTYMYIYVNYTIYGKYMPYIYHIWYNCTAVHSQKLPVIYERGLVLLLR